jgi:hypothetical protein
MVSMRLQQQRHGVCWGCVWPRGVRGTVGEVVPQAASTRKGNARSRRIGPSPTAPAVPVDPHHNRLPRCIFSVPHRCTIPNAHRELVALARQTQTRRTTQTRERESHCRPPSTTLFPEYRACFESVVAAAAPPRTSSAAVHLTPDRPQLIPPPPAVPHRFNTNTPSTTTTTQPSDPRLLRRSPTIPPWITHTAPRGRPPPRWTTTEWPPN